MITVMGEALIDIIVDPDGEVTSVVGGAPLNTARTLARLGESVAFLGGVSSDAFGRRIHRLLTSDGVAMALPDLVEQPSTLAIAQIDEHGAATYRFMMEGTSAAAVTPELAVAAISPDCTAIHVGTLGLVLQPLADAAVAVVAAARPEQIVMVDPNCRPSVMTSSEVFDRTLGAVLTRADVVKVSGDDLAFMSPGVDPLIAATQLQARSSAVVLFTDGANSVWVITGAARVELAVPKVPVIDTVGAGDSFSGGFLAYLSQHGLHRDSLSQIEVLTAAAEFGIQVAGITCQRAGAQPPFVHELPGNG
ncbi:MAG: carbohydrate kinase [Candidatus Nanopelagicales bacterium]|nr:carbohydrate kinase [Candidatus Nanopelagicales bacterium]